jgi:RNA polymerase sigma-70 factor (ECF subfamily)
MAASTPFALDRDAIGAIYVREFDFVWHNLRRLGVPPRDVPDLTHDVFLTVFRFYDRYDSSRPFRPWLFGVLFRVASDHFHLSRNANEVLEDPPRASEPSTSPYHLVETIEQWRIVERALAGVPVSHRVVIVMHDFLGYSGSEVARTLGINDKTVYSRLYKARDLLVELADKIMARSRKHRVARSA